MNQTIRLPVYDMVITRHGEGGTITSNLHDKGEPGDYDDNIDKVNAVIDGVEALVLAHACAGIDVTDPKYVQGIVVAVDGAMNNE